MEPDRAMNVPRSSTSSSKAGVLISVPDILRKYLAEATQVVSQYIASTETNDPSVKKALSEWRTLQRSDQTIASISIQAALMHMARQLLPFDIRYPGPLDHFIPDELPQLPANVSSQAEEYLANEPLGLGVLFESMVPQFERNPLGQFYTPSPIATVMASWLRQFSPPTILDPAVGSGTFLTRFPGKLSLYGIDVNPLACYMAKLNLFLHKLEGKIRCLDFLRLDTDLFSHKIPLKEESFDAIICNPPYSRHQELSRREKIHLSKRFSSLTGYKISGLSPAYLYFFIQSIRLLKPGGHLAFITPAEFLDVSYGKSLKATLQKWTTIHAMIRFDPRNLAFPGVLTSSCITFASRGTPRADHKVVFLEATNGSPFDDILKIIEEKPQDLCMGYKELDPSRKWSRYFGQNAKEFTRLSKGLRRKLGDIARTRRGVATGCNKFFTLTETEVEEWEIEKEFLVPVVTRARDLAGTIFDANAFRRLAKTGRKCWMIYSHLPESKLEDTNLFRYLDHGRDLGIHRTYLAQHRTPWYALERTNPPDIIFTYMSRENPRFALNQAECRIVTSLLGIYLEDNNCNLKELLEYLNSDQAKELIGHIGRIYAGGMKKVEPRELLELPIP